MPLRLRGVLTGLATALTLACGSAPDPHVLTFAGSAVGREAQVLRRQLDRFGSAHPELTIELRPTPDASDQRHQLYVQWLNARATDPDILQLDVVWTPETVSKLFEVGPARYTPGTKMPEQTISDPADREALVRFLERVTR